MSLTELLEQYKAHSLVPPLDSLTRWAYEKGEITSGKKSFSTLNDKDKETILRIGISIGNKRKREREEKIHNNIE